VASHGCSAAARAAGDPALPLSSRTIASFSAILTSRTTHARIVTSAGGFVSRSVNDTLSPSSTSAG
jgi:hypothetical protein